MFLAVIYGCGIKKIFCNLELYMQGLSPFDSVDEVSEDSAEG